MEKDNSWRPIPAPRRLYPELPKSEYENVTVDTTKNKVNLCGDNLNNSIRENQIANNTDDIVKNTSSKPLFDESGLDEYLSVDVDAKLSLEKETAEKLRDKFEDDVKSIPQIYASPEPTLRSVGKITKNKQQKELLEENTNSTFYLNLHSPSQSPLRRKAPDLPPKILHTELNSQQQQRHSISSELSGMNDNGLQEEATLKIPYESNQSRISKSISSTTLNSSTSDGGDASNNTKFKSASPGDLLKSLGTTTKLLTESIGERVALQAKSAKQHLDKNLKSSTDLISNLGTETTSRLKNAGKRFGTNFSLGRRDKQFTKDAVNMPPEFCDRPQTLPSNDKVFNTITFSSPFNQNMSSTIMDLNIADDRYDDSYYKVPSKTHTHMNADALPSYEDLQYTLPGGSYKRIESISPSPSPSVLDKSVNKSNSIPSSDTGAYPLGTSSEAISSLPMKPSNVRRENYEAIRLRNVPTSGGSNPHLLETASIKSLQVSMNSEELNNLNAQAANAEREASMLLQEQIKQAEAKMPKPERSDSWDYIKDNEVMAQVDKLRDRQFHGDVAIPAEPFYVNHEVTYGKVFQMTTTNDALLPQKDFENCKQNQTIEIDENCNEDSANGWMLPPKEIIQEFDPLLLKSSTLLRTNKSNELLLLEHLLEEDTYGLITRQQCSKSDADKLSLYSSEEDNRDISDVSIEANSAENSAQTSGMLFTPKKSSAKKHSSKSKKEMHIVHQNALLLPDDTGDSVLNDYEMEEARVKPYLIRIDESTSHEHQVDLAQASSKRTNWFIDKEEITTLNNDKSIGKLNIQDGESPPSYLEAISVDHDKTVINEQNKIPSTSTAARAARFINPKNVFSNVKGRVDALKRRASFRTVQKQTSDMKTVKPIVPRPSLSPLLVRYEGPLIRFPSGVVEDILKEMQNRKAILRNRQFQTFLDQEMRTLKETIPLDIITTLQCVSDSRVTDNSTYFYCFEITTSVMKNVNSGGSMASNTNLHVFNNNSANSKQQRVTHLYGVGKESERAVWMQKLLESLTNVMPPKYTCHYYRAGWCYLKNSITSEWNGTWLVLKKSQRRLIFVSEPNNNVERMDLRKARCIVLKETDDSIDNLQVEAGPILMIDCPPFTVYMIMASPRETKIWRHIIREVAHNNGFALSDQQLTKSNVPVIVDKCINFVYIHGSMSEGIYRKSGSENSISKLMAAFRTDAFSVEITRNEYNEHDVANVLKRFMRDLPERLIGKLTESFISVTSLTRSIEKIPIYKDLLERLSVIERETLKKIVGHLVFISSQKSKNKMSIQNLAMIWGPTLLEHSQAQEMLYSQKESDVLSDLIILYKHLFPISEDEMKKEQEMYNCLRKYYDSAETLSDTVKKSGDLKMWITLNTIPENSSEEKLQVNSTISPTKTAYEICRELAPKMNLPSNQICLYEVILDGMLERPLHHETKVFDVVLNWSYWPEDDRKNNYLVVKSIDYLREVQRAIMNMATVTPGKELKFVDSHTKSFKTFKCELRDGKIVVSKNDKNDKTTIVREIFLHSTTAYFGCEKKRDSPWSWAITFVDSTKTEIMRSRDSPYIGHVLAGSEWVDRTIWFSSIWYCLYGDNILPPAEIILN